MDVKKFNNRLLIVDGSNLLFQMFYGMPSRIVNKEGKAIHGTLGFVGALIKIIRMTNPTHMVVLFDGEHDNKRTELDVNYKSNRIDYSFLPEEESPFSQITDVYSALDYLSILHTEIITCEVDDVISTYTMTYSKNIEIIISSLDSDFFQLITDNVSVLRYRGNKTIICTPTYVEEKFGIFPFQYADFKSLTGDPSDNIKGAYKVGPKTASYLINEFGNLENIIDNVDAIKKPFIRKAIGESIEKLKVNYQLIKLNDIAPLPILLDELEYHYNGITTTEVLKAIGLR